jgi:hypothetical protein
MGLVCPRGTALDPKTGECLLCGGHSDPLNDDSGPQHDGRGNVTRAKQVKRAADQDIGHQCEYWTEGPRALLQLLDLNY